MRQTRIVVTGMGIVSPVGHTVAESWNSIVNGQSGIDYIQQCDVKDLPSRIAGEVKNWDSSPYLSEKENRRCDRFCRYGIGAAFEAVRDSGLTEGSFDPERVGVCVGSGIGGLPIIESTALTLNSLGHRKVPPFFIPSAIIIILSGHISIRYGFKGPNYSVVTACATSAHAIISSARMMIYGDADVMIVGGAESSIQRLGVSGFAAMHALSRSVDEPHKASRPWDRDRNGFVIGEGAAILVLETYKHAQARGAKIYAELLGCGMNADAFHITSPDVSGITQAKCMQLALNDAGLQPEAVDYINAHGTSTPLGDKAEFFAIQNLFGQHRVPVSSTKSMTGHLLGAAGGLEAIFSILAMQHSILPPTINLDNLDECFDWDFVPHVSRPANLQVVMSNSFGFGGTNASLVFGQL